MLSPNEYLTSETSVKPSNSTSTAAADKNDDDKATLTREDWLHCDKSQT